MSQRYVSLSPLMTAPDIRSRLHAFAKSALYLLMAFVAAVLVSAVLKAATGKTLQQLMRAGPAEGLLAHAALLIALAVIPTAISLRLWHEPLSSSGWAPQRGGRHVAIGLASGAGLITLIVGILWAAGGWSGSFRPVSAMQLLGMTLLSAALWLIQAAHEEALHRGYAFTQLSRALSFWPAALLLSLWFALGHAGHAGATPVSLAVAGLFALLFAYSLLRTGALWFALGFHASWNFTQSFVFGLSNSGGDSPDALMVSRLTGPPLLTGGSAGPEGSILSALAIAALMTWVHFGTLFDRIPEGPKAR